MGLSLSARKLLSAELANSRRIIFFGAATLLLGLMVLAGWSLGIPALTSLIPGRQPMVIHAAICFCVAASTMIYRAFAPTPKPITGSGLDADRPHQNHRCGGTASAVYRCAGHSGIYRHSQFPLPDNEISRITVSHGIAFHHGDAMAVETLLVQADTALYEAKKYGRNTYRVAI